MGRRYSKEEDDFIIANHKILTIKDIGKRLGRPHKSIEYRGREHLNVKFFDKKYFTRENYFSEWSANMAYILGFTTADGYVDGYNSLQYRLNSKDKCILEFINNEICDSSSPIKESFDQNKYHVSKLRIFSNKIINDLQPLGIIRRKTGKEFLPDMPTEYFRDYLRGLFDGDGSISVKKKKTNLLAFKIGMASSSILVSIKSQCNNVGFINQAKLNSGDSFYTWTIDKQSNIEYMYNLMYYNGCFCLERKKKIFQNKFEE